MKALCAGVLLTMAAAGAVASQGGPAAQIDLRDWQQSEEHANQAGGGGDHGNHHDSRAGEVRAGEVKDAEPRGDSERLRGPGAPAPAGSGDGSDHRDASGTSEGSSPYDVPGSPRATGN